MLSCMIDLRQVIRRHNDAQFSRALFDYQDINVRIKQSADKAKPSGDDTALGLIFHFERYYRPLNSGQ